MRRDNLKSFLYVGPIARLLVVVMTCLLIAGVWHGKHVFAAASSYTEQDLDAINADCFARINAEREKAGVPALTWSDDLYQAAKDRAPELAANFSHTRPDGNPWYTAVDAHGYENCRAGENLAYGQRDAAEAVQDWMNSAPHRATLLDGALKETGICVVQINGVLYWAEEFGTLHEG